MSMFGQFVSRATGRANHLLSTLLERDDTVDSFLEAAAPKGYQNGELVFAKNNVCVHISPPSGSVVHIGGYFALYYKSSSNGRSGLLLHWLANDSFFDSTCRGDFGPAVQGNEFSSRPIRSVPKLESQPALSTVGRQAKAQSSFFVDLSTIKRLRFFYTDSFQSAGAFLVVSQENQSKVFHFHTGGLDRLANVMEMFCSIFEEPKAKKQQQSILSTIQEFTVRRPSLRRGDSVVNEPILPDEYVEPLNKPAWFSFIGESGEVTNEAEIRKRIFFKPLSAELRRFVWPFLVGVYSFESTHEIREQIRNDGVIEYHRCTRVIQNMDEEVRDSFWRQVASTVEKDVVRTDRTNPLFAGANNPNCKLLQNVLLNVAISDPITGYTQGMSDLLAIFFSVFDGNEPEMFSVFRRFLHSRFFISPKDRMIDEQLNYLRRLIQMFVPTFYGHILRTGDSIDLLFCHRWILLFFKREFQESDLLRIWDCCFACPDTAYLHLFIALAMISLYGKVAVEEKLAYDETLLFFNEMSGKMNGADVLAEARQLLRAFRRLDRIPCTLYPLVSSAHSPGQWDCQSLPSVQCTADHLNQRCPYDAFVSNLSTPSVDIPDSDLQTGESN